MNGTMKKLLMALVAAGMLGLSACGTSKAIPLPPSDGGGDAVSDGGGDHAAPTDAGGDGASDHAATEAGPDTAGDATSSTDAATDTVESDGSADVGD